MEIPSLNVNYDRKSRKDALKAEIEGLWKRLGEGAYASEEKRILEQKLAKMKIDYVSLGGSQEDLFKDEKEDEA